MSKKILSRISSASLAGGFILMLGMAGASDLGTIDLKTIILNGSISVILMLIGYFGLKVGGCNYVN